MNLSLKISEFTVVSLINKHLSYLNINVISDITLLSREVKFFNELFVSMATVMSSSNTGT